MLLENITALGFVLVYWLKLIVGLIAFLLGNLELAVAVLLLGSLLEIALYSYTMRS